MVYPIRWSEPRIENLLKNEKDTQRSYRETRISSKDARFLTRRTTYKAALNIIDKQTGEASMRGKRSVLNGCNRGIIPWQLSSIFTCVLLRIKPMFTKRQHKRRCAWIHRSRFHPAPSISSPPPHLCTWKNKMRKMKVHGKVARR